MITEYATEFNECSKGETLQEAALQRINPTGIIKL